MRLWATGTLPLPVERVWGIDVEVRHGRIVGGGYYHTKHERFDHGKARYNTAIHIKRDKGIKFDVCFNG